MTAAVGGDRGLAELAPFEGIVSARSILVFPRQRPSLDALDGGRGDWRFK